MKFLLMAISIYGVFILSGLTTFFWYFFIFELRSRSVLKLIGFPFAHFPGAFRTYDYPSVLPIMLSYVTFVGCVFQLLFPSSAPVYVFVWGSILSYEIYGVATYVFKLRKTRALVICAGIILLIIGTLITLTIQKRNYQVMNIFDFIVCIYLFVASVYVLVRIIAKGRFDENVEALFIFFGFIFYSFLHILASSIMALDFVQHFDYAYYATLITLSFWVLVIPWIRYLKSRLS